MNAIIFFDPTCSSDPGKISGTIKIHQCDENGPLTFKVKLKGFKPNTEHGIHIHEYGDLTEGCKGACSHYNPSNSTHGSYLVPARPRHAGDLINNIKADENGNVNRTFEDEILNISDIIGRSVVLHDGADDLGIGGLNNAGKIIDEKKHKESLKTGNAGARLACAIIGLAKQEHF